MRGPRLYGLLLIAVLVFSMLLAPSIAVARGFPRGTGVLVAVRGEALRLYRGGLGVADAYHVLWPRYRDRLIGYAAWFAESHGIRLRGSELLVFAELIMYSVLEDAYRSHVHSVLRAAYGEPRVVVVAPQRLGSSGGFIVFRAVYPSDVPYSINYWAQVTYDVDGGKGTDDEGNGFDVNGGNDLYKIVIYIYSDTHVVYELHYRDEDHPNPWLDKIYDAWRRIWYGRTEDIEQFTVENGVIEFNGIYDNGHTYAHSIGQHGTATRSYSPWVTVYVSNVWNHAMDIYDKNPSLPEYIYS